MIPVTFFHGTLVSDRNEDVAYLIYILQTFTHS